MFSRSEPSDSRVRRSCARYWRNPLTKMPRAVSRTKLAPRRQASRRQIGSRAFIATSLSCGVLPLDGQLGDVALEEQLDGPIEDDPQALGRRRELEHVDRFPHAPRRESGELESAQIGDGSAPAEWHHLTEQAEPERPP